jgi:hypothetical protein
MFKLIKKWFDSFLSRYSVDHIGDHIFLTSNVECNSIASKEIEKSKEKTRSKISRTELKKCTKEQIKEKADELGVDISIKLKKEEMIKQFLKQLK